MKNLLVFPDDTLPPEELDAFNEVFFKQFREDWIKVKFNYFCHRIVDKDVMLKITTIDMKDMELDALDDIGLEFAVSFKYLSGEWNHYLERGDEKLLNYLI